MLKFGLKIAASALLGCATLLAQKGTAEFHPPQKLTSTDGALIAVGGYGYAAPGWGDVDGDGIADLLVGQFDGGKIDLYRGRGGGLFAPRQALEAGGKQARVPGVW